MAAYEEVVEESTSNTGESKEAARNNARVATTSRVWGRGLGTGRRCGLGRGTGCGLLRGRGRSAWDGGAVAAVALTAYTAAGGEPILNEGATVDRS